MRYLYYLILLFALPPFLCPITGQNINKEDVLLRLNSISDSLAMYKNAGNEKHVLAMYENGIDFLSKTDYSTSLEACILYLGAGESNMRLKQYQKAKSMLYKAFLLDEINKYKCNVYNVVKEVKADSNMVYFADMLSIAKTDSVLLRYLACEPDSFGNKLNQMGWEQVHNGKYSAALYFFELETNLLEAIGATGRDNYLSIFPCKILCLTEQKNYKSACSLANYYIELVKQYKGRNSLTYAYALQEKAFIENHLANFDTAIKNYEESLSLTENIVGKYNMRYIRCLDELSHTYWRKDDNQVKRLELQLEEEKLLANTPDAKPSDKSHNFSILSNIFGIIGDNNKSLEYSKKAVDILKDSSCINNAEYANCLRNLSRAYTAINNYEKAFEAAQKSIEIFSKIKRNVLEDIMYRMSISELSWTYYKSGEINKAIITIKKVLTDEFPDDEHKLSDMHRLINYYSTAGLKDDLRKICKLTLKLAERLSGKTSPLYADELLYAATIQGKKGEEIMMLQEAANIYEKHYGKTSERYLQTQRALRSLEFDLIEANEFVKEQFAYLEQLKSLYGEDSRNYLHEYTNCLYRIRSKAYEADDTATMKQMILLGENLLEKIDVAFGKKDILYMDLEQELAETYTAIHHIITRFKKHDTEYFKKSILYMTNVVNRSRILYGKSNIEHIRLMGTLARMMSENPYYFAKTDSIQQIVVNYYKRNYGKDHEYYANASLDLAVYYDLHITSSPFVIGDILLKDLIGSDSIRTLLHRAITLANGALNVYNKTENTEHLERAFYRLSYMYKLNGELDKAAICWKEYFANWKLNTLFQYSMYSSDEKANLVNYFNMDIDRYFQMALRNIDNSTYTQVAYNAQLLGKGLLLSSEIGLREMISKSNDTNGMETITRLQKIKSKLANTTSEENKGRLKQEYRALERMLMKKSQKYGNYMKDVSVTYTDVKTHLKAKDIAIEFVSTIAYDTVLHRQYYALVLKKNYESPKIIKICSEDELRNSKSLYNTIWSPLMDELNGVENVFFAPTMQLNNLPIESATRPNGQLLSKSGINFYRLSSTREIIKANTTTKKSVEYNTAVLYGGLQYDASVNQLIASARKERANGLRSSPSQEALIVDNIRKSNVTWKYLPGTKKEVVEINKIISSHEIKSTLYTDGLGTESTFKSLSKRGVNLIHIATHGFFIRSQDNNQPEDNQLECSGLTFAGANNIKRGIILPNGVDDGILTAFEISQLDLRGLDLIVLSACETGLGIVTFEGVYGLQRGLKKAGAQSIIMSLWPVNDEATQMFMTEFYQSLFNGNSKHDALENAKDYVRTYNSGTYAEAKYWSGFILLDGIR